MTTLGGSAALVRLYISTEECK